MKFYIKQKEFVENDFVPRYFCKFDITEYLFDLEQFNDILCNGFGSKITKTHEEIGEIIKQEFIKEANNKNFIKL